jgi:hypothetical protein
VKCVEGDPLKFSTDLGKMSKDSVAGYEIVKFSFWSQKRLGHLTVKEKNLLIVKYKEGGVGCFCF